MDKMIPISGVTGLSVELTRLANEDTSLDNKITNQGYSFERLRQAFWALCVTQAITVLTLVLVLIS